MTTAVALRDALAGRYAIARELGRGGMATVYLAEDVRHRRRVALKVLHPELSAVLGTERFLKEIELTAGLQHPHILPLFDSGEAGGQLFYVMPLVDGETLRARLERERQLPIEDALRIAREVADALQYAHERGVIHRDVKPENVHLQGGHALVADFGIALAVHSAGAARMTQTGLSLGTPQYMAPEQAVGEREIDARADVYALGAVTYEMLVGAPPFTGATVQAIVAKVITERPAPPGIVRDTIPAPVEDAVLRALAKLPADRFASAAAFAAALATPGPAVARTTRAVPGPAAATTQRAALATLGATAAAALALAAWALLRPRPASDAGPPTRFTLEMPRGVVFDNVYAPLTITHDGRTVIFRALVDDTVRLVRRDLDRLDVVPIPGTEGGGWPAVSPDDRWLSFFSDGVVRRLPLAGGPATPVTTSTGGGTDWLGSDSIVVSDSALRAVAVAGGTGRVVVTPDRAARPGEQLRWPRVLPDGETLLYVSWPPDGLAGARIGVASLRSGGARVLDLPGTTPLGVFDGQLVFVSPAGVLTAAPFDVAARRVTGAPRALVEGVDVNTGVGAARAALSAAGTLVYLATAGPAAARGSQLVALDSGGPRAILDRSNVVAPVWSPDGRRIAVEVTSREGKRDVGILDVETGAFERVTGDGNNRSPVWSPDGKRILYTSSRGGRNAIWWQSANAIGGGERLVDVTGVESECALSPDNRWLVFQLGPTGAQDLWVADLRGDRTPRPLVTEPGTERTPTLSPNGRWLAYSALSATGRQVFVRPFPGPGGATQVSAEGGELPVWGADGRTLYFLTGGRQLVAAALAPGVTMGVTGRRVVLTSAYLNRGQSIRPPYAVSPDGKRFVGLSRPADEEKLVVVTNWLAELRRVPPGGARR